MSKVFIEENVLTGDKVQGFTTLMKEFHESMDECKKEDIFCIGYNHNSGNYYVALENGAQFFWNEIDSRTGWIATDTDGNENEYEYYDEAMSDISY